ncbi:GDSL-type esterase/lipase family protein [Pontibacter sp. G13]|uniref:GDSL-type esterase/lipase family protein n=1 Tax=Pontibacter sp. G13 TaxID=3074898 RepID=UPI0028895740|nr:GDSL-type esterase/lipase family protein [Pontibacter sp. G13]WNJ17222.1 GDSL-type esterase/lipase family protein [Pontibacter sp. G13]
MTFGRSHLLRALAFSLFITPFLLHSAGAQTLDPKYLGHEFIRYDLNRISFAQPSLNRFFHRLHQLETGKVRRVNIVHIGDSHIQTDWWTSVMRTELQRKFGNAGRGLVFPFSIAKTNSPTDLAANSTSTWTNRRIIHSSNSMPAGLSGMVIRTQDPNFRLDLRMVRRESDYRFNKVTLLTGTGPEHVHIRIGNGLQSTPNSINGQRAPRPRPAARTTTAAAKYHDVQAGETLYRIAKNNGLSIQELMDLNSLSGSTIRVGQRLKVSKGGTLTRSMPDYGPPCESELLLSSPRNRGYASTLYFEELSDRLVMQGVPCSPNQRQTTLYGLVVENYLKPGLLYHMIGVNGAKYAHYNRNDLFWHQFSLLDADLVVVSLGTNELVMGQMPQSFPNDVETLVAKIREYAPYADILLTTPNDNYSYSKRHNRGVEQASNYLKDYAQSNGIACWDLYEIMGGANSIVNWRRAGLAQPDHLHFTHSGYVLQGHLLYQALMNAYGFTRYP